jgi:hypothetical protein
VKVAPVGVVVAAFELVLERFAFRLGALQCSVGVAERIGERFVRKIVEAGYRVLPAPCAADYLSVQYIHGEVNIPYRKKEGQGAPSKGPCLHSPNAITRPNYGSGCLGGSTTG